MYDLASLCRLGAFMCGFIRTHTTKKQTITVLFVCSRRGASSGILLGATTLPSVMLSRLIQLSRILPADPSRPEGIILLYCLDYVG
jgi:hypothetical protein